MEKQKVADFLLKEGYLLTALELHVELSEKGHSLPSLTSFFKDSKNFESFISKTSPQSSGMIRICNKLQIEWRKS